VNGLHQFGRAVGLLLGPEGDEIQRAERADKASPEIVANVGVIENTRGDERMSDL
jgi:hypothetical protein